MKSFICSTLTSACILLLSSVPSVSFAADESNHFISENLYTFMHSGPGKQYRILGSLNSGNPVTLLQSSDDGKFVQIRDEKGRDGWIESRALASGQSQQQLIESLNEKLLALSHERDSAQNELSQLTSNMSSLKQNAEEHDLQLEQIKKENSLLQQQLANQQDELKMQWLVNGGLVAGGGVLLGLLISFLPRKQKRSSRWM